VAAGLGLPGLLALAMMGVYSSLDGDALDYFQLGMMLIAAGLLVGGVEKMIGYDWIPALADPVWNSSFLLNDNATVGNLVATLTGYRTHPDLALVLAYVAYWALVLGWPRLQKRAA